MPVAEVPGIEVGQTTIISGDNIRTGVTAILPHSGNLYREKVPGSVSRWKWLWKAGWLYAG